jgi:hypothetical protein
LGLSARAALVAHIKATANVATRRIETPWSVFFRPSERRMHIEPRAPSGRMQKDQRVVFGSLVPMSAFHHHPLAVGAICSPPKETMTPSPLACPTFLLLTFGDARRAREAARGPVQAPPPASPGVRSLGSTRRRDDVADPRGPHHALPASAIEASSAVAVAKFDGAD